MSVSLRVAVVAVVCALAAAGCSTPSPSSPSPSPTPSAASSASPAQPSWTGPNPGSVESTALSAQMNAAMAKVTSYAIEVTFHSEKESSTGSGVVDLRDRSRPRIATQTETKNGVVEIVIVGTTRYIRLKGTTTWLKGTVDQLPAELIGDVHYVRAIYVGPQTLAKEQLHHYSVESTQKHKSLSHELLIDDQNRIRQFTNRSLKVTYTLSKFNEPVTIAEPPASAVR